jgi:hypothetical protein
MYHGDDAVCSALVIDFAPMIAPFEFRWQALALQ